MIKLAFPFLLLILEFAAAAVYAWEGDWRLALYWLLCAGITVAVTPEFSIWVSLVILRAE